MTKVILGMSSGEKYEVSIHSFPNDLQAIIDEVYDGEFFIMNRAGRHPRLLKTSLIETVDIVG